MKKWMILSSNCAREKEQRMWSSFKENGVEGIAIHNSSPSPHPIHTLHAGHVDSVKVQIKAWKKYSTNQTVPKFKFKRALSSGGKLTEVSTWSASDYLIKCKTVEWRNHRIHVYDTLLSYCFLRNLTFCRLRNCKHRGFLTEKKNFSGDFLTFCN